jgi:hypothetical protein
VIWKSADFTQAYSEYRGPTPAVMLFFSVLIPSIVSYDKHQVSMQPYKRITANADRADENCQLFSNCASCAQASSWFPGANCRWCPKKGGDVINKGGLGCHKFGAVLNNPCSENECVTKDFCDCPGALPPQPLPKTTKYDPTIARSMTMYSLAAYCTSPGRGVELECNAGPQEYLQRYLSQSSQVLKVVTIPFPTETSTTTISCYLALDTAAARIVLAFRGTSEPSLGQIIDQITGAGRYEAWASHPEWKVNHFQWRASSALAVHLLPDFVHAREQYPTFDIWITGHSLGGAMASITAFNMSIDGNSFLPSRMPLIYTFGQPRIGNSELAKAYNLYLPLTFRVVNNKDTVPHVPPCSTYSELKTTMLVILSVAA